jgi:hypothetical protein
VADGESRAQSDAQAICHKNWVGGVLQLRCQFFKQVLEKTDNERTIIE